MTGSRWSAAALTLLLLLLAAVASTAQFTLTGTLRDFSSADPDFQHTTAPIDAAVVLTSTTLNSRGLPILLPSSSTSVQSRESFQKWFDSGFDLSRTQAFSISLVASGSVRQFIAEPFFPHGANQNLFTYHVSATVKSTVNLPLTFGSSGDLWVYVNGNRAFTNLGGIHAKLTHTYTLPGSPNDQRIDIFYAHRSTAIVPYLRIELPQVSACTAATSNLPEANVYPFLSSNLALNPSTLAITGTGTSSKVRLTTQGETSSSGCMWNNRLFRITNGFITEFDVEISGVAQGTPEGFAFVINGDTLSSRGGSGGNLGYNFLRNVAVEFDHTANPATGDGPVPHIEFHATYTTSENSPHTNHARQHTGAPGSFPNFATGGRRTVRIVYAPGVGLSVWVAEVYMGVFAVDDGSMRTLFGGVAYLGFCASTGASNSANTDISNWKIWTTPISSAVSRTVPAFSTSSGWGSGIVARNIAAGTPTFQVRSTDSCGTDVTVGGGSLAIGLTRVSNSQPVAGTVSSWSDLSNGLYNVWVFHRTAEQVDLSVRVNGQDISGSPFRVPIVAAAIDASQSTFAPALSSLVAGTATAVTVTAKDEFGNVNLQSSNQFVLRFSTGSDILPSTSAPPLYTFQAMSTLAGPASVYVRHGGDDITGSPSSVVVGPGALYAASTRVEPISNSLVTGVAGVTSVFRVYPLDQWNNPIRTNPGAPDTVCKVTMSNNDNTVVLTNGNGITVTWNPALTPREPHFEVAYLATLAATYRVALSMNNVAVPNPQNLWTPTISPAVEVATQSFFEVDTLTRSAGTLYQFRLQAVDQFGNSRDLPNEVTDFSLSLSYTGPGTPGTLGPVSCAKGTPQLDASPSDPLFISLRCEYDTAGRHVILARVKRVGNYQLQATHAGGSSVPPAGFSIVPGAYSAAQTFVVNAPQTVVAGTIGSLSITSRDVYGNVRASSDDRGVLTTRVTSASRATTVYTMDPPVAGVYTQRYNGTVAGSYQAVVELISVPILDSPVPVTIVHAAISGVRTVVAGAGVNGGVTQTETSFLLTARDVFDNVATTAAAGVFTVRVYQTTGSGSPEVEFGTAVLSPPSAGVYNVSYTIPACNIRQDPYRIVVAHNGVDAVTHTARCMRDPLNSYAQILDTGNLRARAGESKAFIVHDFFMDGGNLTSRIYEPTEGDYFVVAFESKTVANQLIRTSPTATLGTNVWNGAFTPQGAGYYQVAVYFGSILTEQSQSLLSQCDPPAAVDQCLYVGPGEVSPKDSLITGLDYSVTAGQWGQFKVELRDSFSNFIDESRGVFVLPLFSPRGTNTQWTDQPPVDNMDGTITVNFRTEVAGSMTLEVLQLDVASCAPACAGNPYSAACLTGIPSTCPEPRRSDQIACCPAGAETFGSESNSVAVSAADPSPLTDFDYKGNMERLVAGESSTLRFLAMDQYGNLIDDGATVYTFDVELEDNAGLTVVTTNVGSGSYGVTLMPTVSNQARKLHIKLLWNSIVLDEEDVWVDPGQLDGAGSSLSDVPVTMIAGESYTMILDTVDIFGNPWFSDVSFDFSVENGGGACNRPTENTRPEVVPVANHDGRYLVSYTPYVSTSGADNRLRFVFRSAGELFTPVGMPANGWFVNPAILDPTKTVVEVLPSGRLPAGSVNQIRVHLTDVHCNRLTTFRHCDGVVCNELEVFFFHSADLKCQAGSREPVLDNHVNHLFDMSTAVYNERNGSFLISISTEVTGVYSALFRVGRQGTAFYPLVAAEDCRVGTTTRFEVVPLAPFGPECVLGGSAINSGAIAGAWEEFTITLHDKFGNRIFDSAADAVSVGLAGGAASACDANSADWLVVPEDCNSQEERDQLSNTRCARSGKCIHDNEDGTFAVCFQVTQAKTWYLYTVVDGLKVGPPAECPTLRVWNSWVDDFEEARVGVQPKIVGIPDSFDVIAEDRFSNPVVFGDHSYRIQFTRQVALDDPTDGVIDYTFIVNAFQTENVTEQLVGYLVAWAGEYTVEITLRPATEYRESPRSRDTKEFVLTFSAATCEEESGWVDTPYRCRLGGDRTCVGSYGDCDDSSWPAGICNPFLGEFWCPSSGDCRSDVSDCACPEAGFQRCPQGHCIPTDQMCPEHFDASGCPLWAPVRCPEERGGRCAADLDSCPSPFACRPGFVLCADGRSCAESEAQCAASAVISAGGLGTFSTGVCAEGFYTCPSGRCVLSAEDCATPVTCGWIGHDLTVRANRVLCQDGSCRASVEECPDQYPCQAPNTFQCPDGSCRLAAADCPSHLTCGAQGWILCEDGSCRRNVTECPEPKFCLPEEVRCPDGSCQPNFDLCSTQVTCPIGSGREVLCSDGSCARTHSECGAHPVCEEDQVLCPDKSCAAGYQFCPTQRSCPVSHAVRCPNGECKQHASECSFLGVQLSCPASAPVRCGDGSCAGHRSLCPSLPACPWYAPVRCADRRCGAAHSSCADVSLVECPADRPLRCPTGDCAPNRGACPTDTVCPEGRSRCPDGSCRSDCWGQQNAQRLTCPGRLDVLCPQPGIGSFCVSDISQCPVQQTCPRDRPYRCPDASCRVDATECLDPEALGYVAGKITCFGGTWERLVTRCFTSNWCPADVPVKCWEDSCRVVAEDCPPMPGCSPEVPYLCVDGSCTFNIHTCSGMSACDPSTPVRCPLVLSGSASPCVNDISKCPQLMNVTDSHNLEPKDLVPCQGRRQCKDGSCRGNTNNCRFGECVLDAGVCGRELGPFSLAFGELLGGMFGPKNTLISRGFFCPHHAPVLCPSGLCARHIMECAGSDTGCMWPFPHRCGDGSCAQDATLCPLKLQSRGQRPCPAGTIACDNSDLCVVNKERDCPCGPGTALCPNKPLCVPCTPNDGGLCIPAATACDNNVANSCPTANPLMCHDRSCVNTPPNQAPSHCVDAQVFVANACPPTRPFRCADGFCAVSSTQCPIVPQPGMCRPNINYRETLFSDGQNAAMLLAELGPEMFAVVYPELHPVVCADGSCALGSHMCPTVAPCTKGFKRCPDGSCRVLCAPFNYCEDLVNRLPTLFNKPFRCPNGLCAEDAQSCPDDSLEAGGCPANLQKCPGNGMCVADAATDCAAFDQLGNGCEAPRVHRCADGTCRAAAADCPLANGCLHSTPFRCADGTCKATQAECAGASPDCDVGERRCGNGLCMPVGSCVTDMSCPDLTPVRCAAAGSTGGRCRRYSAIDPSLLTPAAFNSARLNMCPKVVVCDDLRPHLCAGGECVADPGLCRPVLPCSDATRPFLCRDFSCAATEDDCPAGVQDRCPPLSPALCPDGSCRRSSLDCPQSDATAGADECAALTDDPLAVPVRCWDGTCASSPLECVRRRQITGRDQMADPWSPSDLDHSVQVCPNAVPVWANPSESSGRLTVGGEFLCHDGSCVLHPSQCPMVPRCPNTHPLRCPDGACTSAPDCSSGHEQPACVAHPVFGVNPTNAPVRGADGTCRAAHNHLEFNGCPASAPYYCSGLREPCVQSAADCFGGEAPGALDTANGWEDQQVCSKDCDRDIVATPHVVTVSLMESTRVVVSQDRRRTVRTELEIPSGALGANGWVRVMPVGSQRIPGARPAGRPGEKPHIFYRDVLSTPFACEASRQGPLFFNMSVKAAIDTSLYQTEKPPEIDPNTVFPCEFQKTFAYEMDQQGCEGEIKVTEGRLEVTSETTWGCDKVYDFTAQIFMVNTTDAYVPIQGTSQHCVCTRVTRTGNSGAAAVGDQICMTLGKRRAQMQISLFKDAETRADTCASPGEAGVDVFTVKESGTVGERDACQDALDRANSGTISPRNVCLAQHTSPLQPYDTRVNPLGEWTCLSHWDQRDLFPVWSSYRGGPQNRVVGRLDRCDPSVAYAFIWSNLGQRATGGGSSQSVFEEYGWIILLVCGGVLLCFLLAAFYLWRQVRYRRKFKEEQRRKEELQGEAARLDEFAGGLGLGDDDVDMVANPLVVEMQRLDREIKQVNAELERAAKAEEREIQDLQEQRQAIYAEIQRVKEELARQQAMAPTRTDINTAVAGGADFDDDLEVGGPTPAVAGVAAPVRHQNFGRPAGAAAGQRQPKKKNL